MQSLSLNTIPYVDNFERLLKSFLLFFIFFFATTNQLIPFPLEKLSMLFFCILYIFFHFELLKFGPYRWAILLMIIAIGTISVVANPTTFSFIVYFPFLGVFFSYILSRRAYYLHLLYYALGFHIVLGLLFWAGAYATGGTLHVMSMGNKGVPFLKASMGLTTTAQTFGTFCVAWLILFYDKYEKVRKPLFDRCMYWVVTFALFTTFNRSSFVAYFIILFFKNKKLLALYGLFILVIFIIFWDIIMAVLFSTATLDSRSELLEGFNISFWESHSLKVYIFGRGNNKITEDILSGVRWSNRSDIENGHAMLLHTYGFLGYIIYMIVCLIAVGARFLKKNWYHGMLMFYFFIVAPYFTQEYVTSTFYIMLAIFLYIINKKEHKQSNILYERK